YSMTTLRPSTHPNSRSRCMKGVIHGLVVEGVAAPRSPIVGSFAARCARAASGHATTAPPSSVMTSRRLTRSPRRRRLAARERHLEAERLRRFQIDHQLELGRLQDRQVGGLFALENPPDVIASVAIGIRKIRSVAHQAADGGVLASRINSRDGKAGRQCNGLFASIPKENGRGEPHPRGMLLDEGDRRAQGLPQNTMSATVLKTTRPARPAPSFTHFVSM